MDTSATSSSSFSFVHHNDIMNHEQRGMKRKRISSCIITPSAERRRQKKNVRFMEYPTIQYTYAADEYDRGGLYDHVVLYKFNPQQANDKPPSPVFTTSAKPKLSVNIPAFIHHHDKYDDDQDSATSTEPSPDTPNDHDTSPFSIRKHRPKLSVDTSICAGPLFFTKLSTNHRSSSNSSGSGQSSDDNNNSFLVPMSALPV